MAEEQEERLVFRRQPLQFRDGDVVQVFRFVCAAVRMIRAPAGIVEVFVEAVRILSVAEADAGAVIAVFRKFFLKRDAFGQIGNVPQGDDPGAEAVAARQQGGIARRRRDAR